MEELRLNAGDDSSIIKQGNLEGSPGNSLSRRIRRGAFQNATIFHETKGEKGNMKKILMIAVAVCLLLALTCGFAVAEDTAIGKSAAVTEAKTADRVTFADWLYGPSSLKAKVTGTKVKLTWGADSSPWVDGYAVYQLKKSSSLPSSTPLGWYTTADSGDYYIPQKLVKKTSASATSCTIDLKKAGTYYLEVLSFEDSPNDYLSSRCRIITVKVKANSSALGKPTGVKAVQTAKTKVTLTWKAGANAKSYAIYRAVGSGTFKKIGTTKKLTFVDKTVKVGKTYKYKIQAIKGSKKVYSSTVKIKVVDTSDSKSVTYRAVVIGQTYESEPDTSSLPGCENDRAAVAKMLDNLTSTKYVTVKSVKNGTKTQILNAIDSVFGQADSDDVSLIYYSGHGLLVGDSYGNPIYDHEYTGAMCCIGGGYIPASELRRTLDAYKGKKVIILDSCHSGHMIGKGIGDISMKALLRNMNGNYIKAFYSPAAKGSDDLAASSYYVLAAASGEQSSYESGGYGIFTQCFVRGIGWDEVYSYKLSSLYADSNGDSKVSLAEAYKYTQKGVDDLGYGDVMDLQVYPTGCSETFFGR